jgi:decaprenylphospho-beta-D-erythro-pentofuranosid-2-ulose 2-reductase
MKTVLLGASKGMGRAVARQLAARGERLFLLGDNVEELAVSARDLEVRGAAVPVKTAHCDLLQPDTFAPALDRAQWELDGFDTVVVTAGIFATQEQLENDPQLTARLLTVDFTNTLLFCEQARNRLVAEKGVRNRLPERPSKPAAQKVPDTFFRGTLCVFSSVAGDRGRKPVVLYGAAKAGLSHYLEGLDHKFRARGLRTICVKPGFVKTGMTAGLKPPPFAGTAEEVARRVLKAIDRGWPEVYVPWPWRWIMCLIRRLPRFVMRRIGF